MSALKIQDLAAKIKASRKFEGERTEDQELRMANMDATEKQKAKLVEWEIPFDDRPQSEGGISMLKAAELIEEEIEVRKARREASRAKPISDLQLQALVNKFGADVEDVKDLTQGEASDLMRTITAKK